MTVASMPMWSAETRSIMRACSATPRKKLPPPTTMATSTPEVADRQDLQRDLMQVGYIYTEAAVGRERFA